MPASGLVPYELPRVPGAVSGAAFDTWRPQRTLPVQLAAPAREQVELELVLPEGWELAYLPPPVQVENGIGSFHRNVHDDGEGTVTIGTVLELRQVQVPAESWPELRRLLIEADAPAGRSLLLRRAVEED